MVKKSIIKSIFYLFIPLIINLYFKCKNKKLFIVDIDNTITDTGLFLSKSGELNERKKVTDMCKKLEIDLEMKKMMLHIISMRNSELIFLTARSYYLYNTTNNWLKNKLSSKKFNLIMVMEASDKFSIVKLFSKSAKQLTLIDDLTFGHETGKVLYHEALIQKIHKINQVRYLGLEDIYQIKKGNNKFIEYIN